MQEESDRSQYESFSIEEKLAKVRNIRIYHTRFDQMYQTIKKCHDSLKSAVGLQCALIEGAPGVGKSILINEYLKDHLTEEYVKNSTKRTILYAEISSPVTLVSFMEDLLEKLHDYNPVAGTAGNKKQRLIRQIIGTKVELIILDEFQHFVHVDNDKINAKVADFFKSLINRTQIPVVLLGIEKEAYRVVASNKQLKDRFTIYKNLHPFGKGDNLQEFRTLLYLIDKELPFLEQSNLADRKTSEKLFIASKGVMRPLMKIIAEASEFAIMDNSTKISETHIKKASEVHNGIFTQLNG